MGDLSPHFDRREFLCRCPDPGCDGKTQPPDPRLIETLEALRAGAGGQPILVNSGRRCAAHNRAVGGAANSAHVRGLAADLRVPDSARRYALVAAAIRLGLRRLGVGPTVLHVDVDASLPQEVLWIYGADGSRH